MNNFFNSLINFKDYTSRKQYWTFMISLLVVLFGVGLIVGQLEIPLDGFWFTGIVVASNFILLPAILVRRLRDCGWSPWLTIFAFLPFTTWISIILFGLIKSIPAKYVDVEVVYD